MRCPSCNKFVPFDTEVEPEQNADPEISGSKETGYEFVVSYRRILTCEECSEELKEAEIELSHSLADEEIAQGLDDNGKPQPLCDGDHTFVVESCEAEPTSRMENVDRHGKPIKLARFMKSFYGVHIAVEAKCETCNATVQFDVEDDCQASGFDELT